MKTSALSKFVVLALFATTLNPGWGQQTDATKDIEKVIGDFLNAISTRDGSAMRNVLAKQFVGMDVITERGNKNARIEFIDTAKNERILPPEGNTDMANLRVSSLKAEFSDSNPTVAIASFVASRPLTQKELERFRKAIDPQTLKDAGVDPADYKAERARIQKWVSKQELQLTMFAMLGRQDGKWRIVCMSFPE